MSLNRFQFIGNLTKDAEIAPTSGDRARGRMRLAVNQTWNDAQGQRQERTGFFNITLWGRDAENAAKYLGRGSSVFVEGRIDSTEYEKGGEKVYGNDFVASTIQYLDTRKPSETGE